MTRPAVVLVGPPGAGKSTVGALLAGSLGLPFLDTDDEIASRAGKPIPDIFFDDGEPAFRDLERTVVAHALDHHEGVLGLGGGAVLDAATRAHLAGHQVVLLGVGLSDAARRVGLSRDRPVLAINPRATLHLLLAERAPLYAEVAVLTVDTDAKTPEQVRDEVLAGLGR